LQRERERPAISRGLATATGLSRRMDLVPKQGVPRRSTKRTRLLLPLLLLLSLVWD
jgi:hypothetical protein